MTRPDETPPGTAERLWTKRELAAYLGVGLRTLARMPVPRVTLPGTGRRAMVRFDPVQVRAWLDAQRSRPLTSRKAG